MESRRLTAANLPPAAIAGLRYYEVPEQVQSRTLNVDVCVYGATSGGVAAAIQAARMGKKTVLLAFGRHIGGMTTGGLSHTDGGEPEVTGGIAREFYTHAGQSHFRPSVAEMVYRQMLDQAGVDVYPLCHLADIRKAGTRLMAITMDNGLEVTAAQFIDATYEGDLMAWADVSYFVGREPLTAYDEQYNGIRVPGTGGHDWPADVDPFVVPGEPSSGLLPRITNTPGVPGHSDARIQAYCFRMWLTTENPLPFPKPPGYDPREVELLARLFETGVDPRPQFSLDTNNHHLFDGAYFIDYVGGNYDWPDGDYLTRERIYQAHVTYQLSVMWFLANDDRVPERWRTEFARWGLPRDEYRASGGWAHELYIREGRRMVSDVVMTEHHCLGKVVAEDSIGLASYGMDSHHCQMVAVPTENSTAVRNEGNVEVSVGPYPVSYQAITPKRAEATNLLVPLALSSTHIAFGSIRMEPVFMILGQSAATAACHAIDQGTPVQDIDAVQFRARLEADGQKLT